MVPVTIRRLQAHSVAGSQEYPGSPVPSYFHVLELNNKKYRVHTDQGQDRGRKCLESVTMRILNMCVPYLQVGQRVK